MNCSAFANRESGDVLGAMDTMYQRGKIQEESMYYGVVIRANFIRAARNDGGQPLIGVNTYLPKDQKGGQSALSVYLFALGMQAGDGAVGTRKSENEYLLVERSRCLGARGQLSTFFPFCLFGSALPRHATSPLPPAPRS